MPLCTHLALASAPEILLMWLAKTFHSGEPQISSPTYPRRPPILAAHLSSKPTYPQHTTPTYPLSSTPTYPLSSTPTYPQHLPILNTYRTGLNPEGRRVRKVSAMRHPVLLGMANFSPESEYMRNQGCRIYRITGKFAELGVLSCRA